MIFFTENSFKKIHEFLLHYGSDKNVFEEKPLNYTTIGEMQKYEINLVNTHHSHDYDFYNSESLVDDFLLTVKNTVKRSKHVDFTIKSGFSLENTQPSSFENKEPIANSQYWSTEPV